jgi:hypothetical protein
MFVDIGLVESELNSNWSVYSFDNRRTRNNDRSAKHVCIAESLQDNHVTREAELLAVLCLGLEQTTGVWLFVSDANFLDDDKDVRAATCNMTSVVVLLRLNTPSPHGC